MIHVDHDVVILYETSIHHRVWQPVIGSASVIQIKQLIDIYFIEILVSIKYD